MGSSIIHRRIILWTLVSVLLIGLAQGTALAVETEKQLKTRIETATKDLKDLSLLGTVVESDKKVLAKVDPNYARLYEFKSARIMLKIPGKLRMEGKLGMVRFEYIVNGGMKIFRASPVKINKKEDYSKDPAKLQSALDIGLLTPSLWDNRKVEIVDDPECESKGEIKLRLKWPKGDMSYYIWIDTQNLWMKRFEKRDAQNNIKVATVYSNPKNIFGNVWMPTRAELYTETGEKAGASEVSDVKYNIGLPNSLFE